MEIRGTRARELDVPVRYIARDRYYASGRIQPEHAVWDPSSDEQGQVKWVDHPQGGQMSPFTGPDEEWEKLTEGVEVKRG